MRNSFENSGFFFFFCFVLFCFFFLFCFLFFFFFLFPQQKQKQKQKQKLLFSGSSSPSLSFPFSFSFSFFFFLGGKFHTNNKSIDFSPNSYYSSHTLFYSFFSNYFFELWIIIEETKIKTEVVDLDHFTSSVHKKKKCWINTKMILLWILYCHLLLLMLRRRR